MNIQQKRIKLKLKSAEDLDGAFQEIKSELSFTSILFNEFLLLFGRFKDVNEAFNRDTVTRFDRNIELAKIRGALLEMLDKINETDLETIEEVVEEILENEPDEVEEELGFYDYLEIAENGFQETTLSLTRLSEHTNEFSSKITEKTEKITRLNSTGNTSQSKTLIVKKFLQSTSKEFDRYNSRMEAEVAIFGDVSGKSLEAYYRAVEFYYSNNLQKESENELREVYNSIVALGSSCGDARIGLMKMYSALKQIPQMQKDLNKSKKTTEKHLEKLIANLEKYRNMVREFRDYLELNLV